MQPVAQINLERVGKLLGEKLGDGLHLLRIDVSRKYQWLC
jgi:hypothetical protein